MKKPEKGIFARSTSQVQAAPEPSELYSLIGHRISEARESKGWTQEQLGRLIGETGLTISRWENAARRPKVDDVVKLAKALGRDVLFFTEKNLTSDYTQEAIFRSIGELSERDKEEVLKIINMKREKDLSDVMGSEE
ncbi:helix-turn-helix domain-containing protein [Deinococcus sp. SL84]|uniref:helix-turn-helix domain-containing protein n=1 Tax=Deinococcus sp. SL84 TaxID=2994663 RepID=UPI0022725BAB|nr:helix-turn-helix transcriptional regulator [Deinococcus sp. SL84]MCY1703747.1 helix-turn-helix transcriptional regulator [Deinococcus sp. SL84]MCY1703783.1 helix-turn-helix transcriptional regulator [Deinococcus sp. SL84]